MSLFNFLAEDGPSKLQQIESYVIQLTILLSLIIVCIHVLIGHATALFGNKKQRDDKRDQK